MVGQSCSHEHIWWWESPVIQVSWSTICVLHLFCECFYFRIPTCFCKVRLWHTISIESWILIVHWVHVLNSAVWQTKPCSNHAFPRQNSPLLATLQMYSNLHSYVKTSSNEPKYWHVIMAYHGHMKFEPQSFLKTFSTTFTAWRVAFDHFSCCYLAAKYTLRSPELKSTNLQIHSAFRGICCCYISCLCNNIVV